MHFYDRGPADDRSELSSKFRVHDAEWKNLNKNKWRTNEMSQRVKSIIIETLEKKIDAKESPSYTVLKIVFLKRDIVWYNSNRIECYSASRKPPSNNLDEEHFTWTKKENNDEYTLLTTWKKSCVVKRKLVVVIINILVEKQQQKPTLEFHL